MVVDFWLKNSNYYIRKVMKQIAIIPLVLILLLSSCARNSSNSQSVTFYEPKSMTEKLIYKMTKDFLTPITTPKNDDLIGYNRLRDLARDFLLDIGGEQIEIRSENGEMIDAIYFNPARFRAKEIEAYKKWRVQFALPKNSRLAQIFEVNYNSQSIQTLLSLPSSLKSLPSIKERTIGALCLPTSGIVTEFDPKLILNFLIRGIHVITINYRNAKNIPNWKSTSQDAITAFDWLAKHLRISQNKMIVCGKGFGSGPATYTAVKREGSALIIDRGFSRMSHLCKDNLPYSTSIIEKFYRYPNEDWIAKVEGSILIIDALSDRLMEGEAKKLAHALQDVSDKPITVSEKKQTLEVPPLLRSTRLRANKLDEETLRDRKTLHLSEQYDSPDMPLQERKITWIKVTGGHFERFWNNGLPSWYSDEKSQQKLDHFLKGL